MVGPRALFPLVLSLAAAALHVTPSAGATDWVDPSFGGKPVTIDLGPGPDKGTDLVVQPDGRIVVVGTADEGGEGPRKSDIAVLRLHPDGRLDSSFGDGGRMLIDDDLALEAAGAVALQPDGKIVIAGSSTTDAAVLPVVVRLDTSGRLDPGFNGGVVTFLPTGGHGRAADVKLQPDGKIVVAGSGSIPGDTTGRATDFMVARLHPNGTMDESFGDGGATLTPFGGYESYDAANSVLLQPDGRIVLAGTISLPYAHALVRYLPTGAPDPSFGKAGKVVNTVAGQIAAAALRPDGTIVTAGDFPTGPAARNVAVSRYRPDGSLDRSFGAGGTTVTHAQPTSRDGTTFSNGGSFGSALAVDRRGRLVVAGTALGFGNADLAVVRHNAAGGHDTSFGRAGWIKTEVAGDYDTLTAIGLLGDGRIVAAGSSSVKGDDPTMVVVIYPSSDRASTTKAWGHNSLGQLGDGTTADARAPRALSAPTTAQALAGGAAHSVALDDSGRVFAWGWNALGQVGDGTAESRLRPVPVRRLTGVSHVAAGYFHNLAVRGGEVHTWGWNAVGQLGDGTTVQRHDPVPVSGLTGVVGVAAGVYHSVALRSDGTVWAWGWNGLGQLGDGTTVERHRPVAVAGLRDVVAVAAGAYHSLALKKDGSVWAWGWNGFGHLGDGSTTERHTPVRAHAPSPVVALAAGAYHNVALSDDGSLWAWGFNALGQVGDGTTADKRALTKIGGVPPSNAVAAGLLHSGAIGSDGRLRTWGWNGLGQLGDNSTATVRSSPVLTADRSSGMAVAAGAFHTFALTAPS